MLIRNNSDNIYIYINSSGYERYCIVMHYSDKANEVQDDIFNTEESIIQLVALEMGRKL